MSVDLIIELNAGNSSPASHWQGGEPFALVDVEASVFASPELDLCLWEILLTRKQFRQFKEGFCSVAPLPDLRPYCVACRSILLALEVESSCEWRKWQGLSRNFDDATLYLSS